MDMIGMDKSGTITGVKSLAYDNMHVNWETPRVGTKVAVMDIIGVDKYGTITGVKSLEYDNIHVTITLMDGSDLVFNNIEDGCFTIKGDHMTTTAWAISDYWRDVMDVDPV
jgi:hypothetical protein